MQRPRHPMDQFTAHLDRGWDLVSRGDVSGALLSAKQGIELDAESPEAHNLLGFVLAAQGEAEQALSHYQHALALDDGYVDAMLNAAEIMVHPLGDPKGAMFLVDDAIDLMEGADEQADALLLKIDILLHMGDRPGARRVADELPEGPFDNPRFSFLLGRAKLEVGDLESADPLLREAEKHDADNPDVHYFLGRLAEGKKDLRAATLSYLRARHLDMAGPQVPFGLSADRFEAVVQKAIASLPRQLSTALDGALVVVSDVPGAEVVAEGVDPRIEVLLDMEPHPPKKPERVIRVFVYQRNIERGAGREAGIGLVLVDALTREIEVALKLSPPLEGSSSEPARGPLAPPLPEAITPPGAEGSDPE